MSYFIIIDGMFYIINTLIKYDYIKIQRNKDILYTKIQYINDEYIIYKPTKNLHDIDNSEIYKYKLVGKNIMFDNFNYNLYGRYKFIIKNQNNPNLIKISTLVTLIQQDGVIFKVYIPTEILIDLDEDYYNSCKSGKYLDKNYDIVLATDESIQGFFDYLKDYLEDGSKIILFKEPQNLYKFVISDRYNKFKYTHLFPFNSCKNLFDKYICAVDMIHNTIDNQSANYDLLIKMLLEFCPISFKNKIESYILETQYIL